MEPIGFIRTPFPEKFGIPRQPGLAPTAVGTLTLEPEYNKEGIFDGLEDADFLWLVFYFHQQKGEWKPKIRPPRAGGNQKRGVFATRSPNRPNPIGLSVVKLLSVDRRTNTLELGGVDLLDGTPILDVKPYVPYSDCHPEANFQFAHKAPEAMPVVWAEQALQELPQEIKKLADKIKAVGKAKMQIPMNHAALPMGPKDLLDLGVGYTHVSPPPTAVLLRSLRERMENIRQEIG